MLKVLRLAICAHSPHIVLTPNELRYAVLPDSAQQASRSEARVTGISAAIRAIARQLTAARIFAAISRVIIAPH